MMIIEKIFDSIKIFIMKMIQILCVEYNHVSLFFIGTVILFVGLSIVGLGALTVGIGLWLMLISFLIKN